MGASPRRPLQRVWHARTVALATRKLASALMPFTSSSHSFIIFFTRAKGSTCQG